MQLLAVSKEKTEQFQLPTLEPFSIS